MSDIKLVAWDVDGVLTEEPSVWDFLLKKLGFGKECEIHKRMYNSGQIDYNTWAKLDISLMKGIHRDKIEEIISKIKTREGINNLLSLINNFGITSIIISSGIDLLAMRFNIPYFTNKLIFHNNKLSGIEILCSVENKGKILSQYIKTHNINNDSVIAIGDSLSDISMFKVAGNSISFINKNTDETIIKYADYCVDSVSTLQSVILSLIDRQTP